MIRADNRRRESTPRDDTSRMTARERRPLPRSPHHDHPVVVHVGPRGPRDHERAQRREEPIAVVVREEGLGGESGVMRACERIGREHCPGVVLAAVDAVGVARERPGDAVMPSLASYMASLSDLGQTSISNLTAEYAVTRAGPDGRTLYLIDFLRDADGVWRLDSM